MTCTNLLQQQIPFQATFTNRKFWITNQPLDDLATILLVGYTDDKINHWTLHAHALVLSAISMLKTHHWTIYTFAHALSYLTDGGVEPENAKTFIERCKCLAFF